MASDSSNQSNYPPISRDAFNKHLAREDTSAFLKIHILVLLGLLLPYTYLVSSLLTYQVAQIRDSWTAIPTWILSFAIAWISLRIRPTYLLISLCVILSLSSRASLNSAKDWLQCVEPATISLILFAFRLRFQSFAKRLSEQIHAALNREERAYQAPQKLGMQYGNQLALFAIKSLVVVLTLCFFAYITSFLIATLLSNTPLHGNYAIWRRIAIDADNKFWPPAWLLVSLIAITILLTQWEWRRITPEQASIALRSDNVKWQYSDLRRILTTRRKRIKVPTSSSNEDSYER